MIVFGVLNCTFKSSVLDQLYEMGGSNYNEDVNSDRGNSVSLE